MNHTLKIRIFALFIWIIANSNPLQASGGDDHSHGPEEDLKSVQTAKYFSIEASSDKYELLLRYEPIHPNEPAKLILFVSSFATNRPIDSADISIRSQEDSSLVFQIRHSSEGTYILESRFTELKKYSLAVRINASQGADLILLSGVEVGKELVIASEEHVHAHLDYSNWLLWLIVISSLVIGLFLGLLFQKRNTKSGRSTIAIFLIIINCFLPLLQSEAHGDDDHGASKSGTNFSNSFLVPKETQFLFDVITQKLVSGSFTGSIKLFGTIIPSSGGQAQVGTPQNGKILTLFVNVGQYVKAGQQLAIVEQNLDAGTQVNMMSEKNKLLAEYEASKKEIDRLNTIADIAAKKDMDEANARFQKADSNLKLFKGNAGRTFVLQSPIAGVLGNFSLSIGSTVNAGQNLFTITNLSQIYAEAQVFDKDAAKVRKGAKFTIECANDSHITSEVKLLSLAQEINASNQSQRVLFQLNNPDNDFKIGEFVNIRVFASESSHQIVLPNSAITEINGKPVVFIKDAAEKYSVSYVQLGENNGSFTSILKGVEEDERIVVNASYQLKMIFLNQ
ncbi:MAG: efflux RND transporter periplasmic adaptor subunit [Saprospiraceae bacterium]|nr:efflux RND transporter periplasmic adaptor subunit [Saprospiraceae bacterium]